MQKLFASSQISRKVCRALQEELSTEDEPAHFYCNNTIWPIEMWIDPLLIILIILSCQEMRLSEFKLFSICTLVKGQYIIAAASVWIDFYVYLFNIINPKNMSEKG